MRGYRATKAVERGGAVLLKFQTDFVSAITSKSNPAAIAALSCPRGNGKSWLAGALIARSMTPGDVLFEAGTESILVSASRSQAAIVLEFARSALREVSGYRWSNDGAIHVATRTRVRIISSDARRAFGLGANTRFVVCDEPASWGPTSGRRLWDAIATALGKRETSIVLIGTLSPAPAGSFWPALVQAGTSSGTYVQLLQANDDKWRDFSETLRVNPVALISPFLRQTLEREHAAALVNARAAQTYKNYRLNLPGGEATDAQPLVTPQEWARVVERPVPACEGSPVVAVDLGGSRSWSAACAIWPSGRIEAWALAPGSPSLVAQAHEDQVSEDLYTSLAKSGGLSVDEAHAVPSIALLLARVWVWEPSVLVADPYRVAELHQTVGGRVRVIERARAGAETVSNIQAARSLLLDSTAGVTESSRDRHSRVLLWC